MYVLKLTFRYITFVYLQVTKTLLKTESFKNLEIIKIDAIY